MQKVFGNSKNIETTENKMLIDFHCVDLKDFLKKYGQEQIRAQGQTQTQTQTQTPDAITPDLVHWDKLEKFRITRESMEKTAIWKKCSITIKRT
ncbi:MAG: hypothetical protein LBK58_02715 [Prevotellaceae bacterium]|nr:hypothetical protein [Prevotellaceae bacterium]